MNRRLRAALYRLERVWVRGPVAQICLLLMALGIFALLGGLIMFLLHPGYANYAQACWWAFLHLTDTGYMGGDKDPLERVMSIFLTFTGALLFVGGVIAILTTSLDRLMSALAAGRTRVVEEGHLLLLGSNPGLPDLIAECACAAAQRWPQGPLPTVVVLCESPLQVVLPRTLPAAVKRRTRVITRTGSPAEEGSLDRVDFARASAIVVLSSRARWGAGPSDLNVLKTLVALRSCLPPNGPRVVLDLSHPTNARLIPSLAGSISTEVLASLEISGRLLCQCLRFPGISQAYRQLLSDALGQSILLRPCHEDSLIGQSLGQAMATLRGGIVLGVLSQGSTYLLALDRQIQAGDELVVLADNLKDIEIRPSLCVAPCQLGTCEARGSVGPTSVLVVGWNEGLLSLLRELGRYTQESYTLTIAAALPPELESAVRAIPSANLEIELLPISLRQREDLEKITRQNFDRILLMAGEQQDPWSADAETALRFALLLERQGRFVVELHEESNAPLFAGGHDVLTSDQIINHMLAQVALKPACRGLYEELFSHGGAELSLVCLDSLLPGEEIPSSSSWGDLQTRLLQRGLLALGIQAVELILNPAVEQSFAVNALTRVLVLQR